MAALRRRLPSALWASTASAAAAAPRAVARLPATQPFEGARGQRRRLTSASDEGHGLGPLAVKEGLWARFVHLAYRTLGSKLYPEKADICNCGADLGLQIPRPDLIVREGVKRDSREFRMQLYGAALYWHVATMPGEVLREADPNMFRGKDVLEVACMRGGGARYLAEVMQPRSYVATDNVQEFVDACIALHSEYPGLRFERADALDLPASYEAESFDFVLCVQAAAQFADLPRFVQGAWHVLRPGGRLMMCDGLTRDRLKMLLDSAEACGFEFTATSDLSRAVHAVGLCTIPAGTSYLRLVAVKPEGRVAAPQVEAQEQGAPTEAQPQ